MKIKYHGHSIRSQKAMEKKLQIATDYMSGMTAIEIAKKYGVSRNYVYIVLRELREEPIN